MYATVSSVAKAEAKITIVRQPAGMAPVSYYEALWVRPLGCGMVYKDRRFKETFIESLRSTIC